MKMRKKTCAIMLVLMSLTLNACGTTVAPTSPAEATSVEETSDATKENTSDATEENTDESTTPSATDDISTSTDVDPKEISIKYPSGYFEDDVDITLEIDSEKTQANLKNSGDLQELFGSSLSMGSFLGIEDNGYFLMIIGAGVYYEGTWEKKTEDIYTATCKNMNSGEEETLEISMDNDSRQFVTTVYGEKIYWKSTSLKSSSSDSTEIGSYKSVLDSAYDIVSGTNTDPISDDGTIGLIESSAGNATEALAHIGYCIMDIDENGTNELLIVDNSNGDNRILDIYSLDSNGLPICLAGGWARNRFYLNGKNNIVNIGSGGADSTVYMTYQVGKAAINLDPVECYFTDYADENREQLGWYHNANGGAVKEDSEWIGEAYDDSITAEIESKYANHYEFDLTYFKDYQK